MTRIGFNPTPTSPSVALGFRVTLPSAINRGRRSFYSERGFSLLELLLVLFIMGLMTATTMLMTGGVEDQAKYDETKRRMELIKRAIVGDVTRTVNGGPEIGGFVADMGRLPAGLPELLEQGALLGWDVATSAVATSSAGSIPIELHGGWRGSYLEVMPDADGGRAFRDGYGVEFAVSAVGAVFRAQSLGQNATAADADDYPVANMLVSDVGYPASAVLVNRDDWIAATSGVSDFTVEFGKAPAANQALLLRVYWVETNTTRTIKSCESAFDAVASSVQAIAESCADLPVGRLAAVVVCNDTNQYLYDGDCAGDSLHIAPFYFALVPRTQLPTIRWNIQ